MDGLFNGLTLIDFHDDLYRNIVSLRESQELYDDLSDSASGWQAAVDLEMATKPRTYLSTQPAIDRPFEESAFNEAIHYPFGNWSNSRYSDGSFGIWYGANTLETSIHETAYHWRTQLLEDVGWHTLDGVAIERKIYLVRCDAGLLNFIPKLDEFPALTDPAPGGYYLTHQVGARIHHDGHPGLLTRSARCDGQVCAIFTPRVLSTPRQTCYLTYRTKGHLVVVERQPGQQLMTI